MYCVCAHFATNIKHLVPSLTKIPAFVQLLVFLHKAIPMTIHVNEQHTGSKWLTFLFGIFQLGFTITSGTV